MKKIVAMASAIALTVSLLAGCGNSPDSSTAPSESGENLGGTAQKLSGSVATNGSTSIEKVIASLSEAFMEKNPDVRVTYDATGSGAGITAASEGTADFGLSSRNLKETESGLEATIIALDGIAIIVNNNNKIEDLSAKQIAGIFTGEITNWSEVGGNNSPIAIIGREPGSGTRDGFESIIGVADECIYDQELTSTGACISAVAANEYAIGYASLSAVSDKIRTVTVGGVACTEESVKDGTYTVQRPFIMVTSSTAELSDEAQAFLQFALSPDAAGIIAGAGAVQPK